MCMAPSMPGQGGYWQTAVPGMTPEEAKSLPSLSLDNMFSAGIGGVAELKQQRDAAIDKWKSENPERYQAALQEQSGQPVVRQDAQNARRGAGGGGGGGAGASSANTLLTSGATQGVDPAALDLSKNTLLGL